jgi:chromosome segregation ATPase
MQTRNKIVILLLGVTLVFGVMIFAYVGDNDESLYRFRMLLAKNPRQLLAEITRSLERMNGLWYAGVSLFAVVMTGLAIRSLSGAEIRAFRDRLVALQVDRAELETSLQDAVWREKHARAAQDAAVKDLEERSSRFLALERELTENEKLVRSQERELKTLRGRAAPDRPSGISPSVAQEKALRDELKEKTALLQTKDAAAKQLERKLTESVSALESQLGLKESSLQMRDKEIVSARAQIDRLTASSNETRTLLQEQLKKEKETYLQRETQLKESEKDLTAKLQMLDRRLLDKEEALLGRTSENERLKTEVETVKHRMTDAASAYERDMTLLQQELKKKSDAAHSKDRELKKLETDLGSKIEELENGLKERDALVEDRTGELNGVKAELTGIRSAKEQSDQLLVKQGDKALEALRAQMAVLQQSKDEAESAWTEKLKKERQFSQAKDAALKQLEKNLKAQIDSLTQQLGENRDSLQGRALEIASLKAALGEKASSTERAESLLQQELKRKTDLLR